MKFRKKSGTAQNQEKSGMIRKIRKCLTDCQSDTRASHTCSHMQNIKVNLGIYMLQLLSSCHFPRRVRSGSGCKRKSSIFPPSCSRGPGRPVILLEYNQTWCSTPCHFFMYCVIHLSRTLDKFYILYV